MSDSRYTTVRTIRSAPELPTETLQAIFEEVVDAIVSISKDTCYTAHSPPSGRTILLQEALYNYGHEMERKIAVGDASPWSLVLRARKQLILVCRSWWVAGIQSIYERVHIHRVGQLPALVRTLEQSALSGEKSNTADNHTEQDATHRGEVGYGRWVKHITMEFHLPRSWLAVYCEGVERLLDQCPNLLSLDHRPTGHHSLFMSPLSDAFMEYIWNGSNGADLGNDSCQQRMQLLRSLKHLTLGACILVTNPMGRNFIEAFKNLTSLEFSLLRQYKCFGALQDDRDVVPLTFPCLRYLAILLHSRKIRRAWLTHILTHWHMRALTSFSALEDPSPLMEDDWKYKSEAIAKLNHVDLENICNSLGDRLEHLHLERPVFKVVSPWHLQFTLRSCPKIKSIAFPCDTQDSHPRQAWDLPHTNIEVVTLLLTSRVRNTLDSEWPTDSCTLIIRELAGLQSAPKLTTVRLSDMYLATVPRGHSPGASSKKHWAPQFADLLAESSITLENHSGCKFFTSSELKENACAQRYLRAPVASGAESYVEDGAASDNETTSFEDSDVGSDVVESNIMEGIKCSPCCEDDSEEEISWDDALERFEGSLRWECGWEVYEEEVNEADEESTDYEE